MTNEEIDATMIAAAKESNWVPSNYTVVTMLNHIIILLAEIAKRLPEPK